MKFSIIVPVYKVEKYICSCIESILNQEYPDWELLLIDDGSPDNSGIICDKYAKTDSRIKVFHQVNRGVSCARNVGLNNAVGEYILFVDADDMIYPDALITLEHIVETSIDNLDMVQFSMNNEYNIYEKDDKISGILTSEEYIEAKVFNVCVGGTLYCHDVIKDNNIRFNESIKYAEDQLFFVEYLKYSRNNIRINNVLYYYRITNAKSATHNPNSEEIVKSVNAIVQYKSINKLSERVLNDALLAFVYYLSVRTNYPISSIYELYRKSDIANVTLNYNGLVLFRKIARISPILAITLAKLYGCILKLRRR